MLPHSPNSVIADSEYPSHMGDTTTDWQALRDILRGPAPDAHMVLEALTRVWPDDAQTSLTKSKLHRWERPRWASPILSFDIERHGATVHGSKKAEVHTWSVNVDAESVTLVGTATRQLHKNDARLDVEALANKVVAAVALGPDGPAVSWLKWSNDGGVQVVMNDLIPMTNKQTTAGRRKRFGTCFQALMESQGWERRGRLWHPRDAGDTTG